MRSYVARILPIENVPTRNVTSLSDESHYDFPSRCLAPAMDIDEVPVTGAAHVVEEPIGQIFSAKRNMNAIQGSVRGDRASTEIVGCDLEKLSISSARTFV